MKKVLCILIILVSMFAAYADSLDVKGMSDDELLAVYSAIVDEIAERELPVVAKLPQGTYKVGVQIKEGLYIVENDNIMPRSIEKNYITVYDSDGSIIVDEKFYVCDHAYILLDLKDGQTLKIQGANCQISKSYGLWWLE